MLQFVESSPERKCRDCTDEADAARGKAPEARTILVNGALAAGLAVLAAAAVIWVPFLEPIRDRFADTEPGWVAAAFVLQLLSVLSFVVALRGAFDRRLGWRESFDVGVVEESANVFLPSGGSGGLALGAVILIRSGIPTGFAVSRSAVLFLVTSAVSGFALVIFGTLGAIGVMSGDASLVSTLIPAAIAALIVAGIIFLPRAIPQIDPEKGGKIHHGAAAAQAWLREAVDSSVELVVERREILLILGAIGYYGFDVASMGAAFEALGGGGPALSLFVLAYTIGHAGAIVPLPGSAEGGLVGAFTLYGSALSLSAGGILLYRVFHAGVPFLLGALGLADMGRKRRAGEPIAGEAAMMEELTAGADGGSEPTASSDGGEPEPAGSSDGKVEPAVSSDGGSEPPASSDGESEREPVASPSGEPEPVVSADDGPGPARPDADAEPASGRQRVA